MLSTNIFLLLAMCLGVSLIHGKHSLKHGIENPCQCCYIKNMEV